MFLKLKKSCQKNSVMDIISKSLLELKELLVCKAISQKELFDVYFNRIKKYDTQINAFVTLDDANNYNKDKQFSGIPISIKDNFNTKGVRTTASSKVLDTYIAPYNATVVDKLLGAGFSNLGKTNLDAWAHGSSTETSDYGVTKNPWDTARVAGGSSGGAAAAVSAGLCPVALGSETAGSIRQPAAWCGTVGLKPTYGRVSRYGAIAMGSSFDCPGPITKNVTDAALMLEILAGQDLFDGTTSNSKVAEYSKLLGNKKKFTIGICDDYLEGVSDDIKNAFEKELHVLQKLGHTIKKISLLPPKYSIAVYTILQRSEVSSNLNRYTGVRYGANRDAFGEEAKRRIMLGTYALSAGYADEYYKKAIKVRGLIIENFKEVFSGVDIIAAPTTPVSSLLIGESANYPFFGEVMDVLLEPAAIAGLPAVSVPMGLDSTGLPMGIQFMGNHLQEEAILNLAKQYEDETNFYGVIEKGLERYR
jgi:aspartyl-tRNA(Asn)/glutamyl-tRNA(Gln) amidotransferase subunit A